MYSQNSAGSVQGYMPFSRRIEAIVARSSSSTARPFRQWACSSNSNKGPLGLFEPLLRNKALAPFGLVGYNANGKTSTAEAQIQDGMLTDGEYQQKLITDIVEDEELLEFEYEEGRQEVEQPCSHDGDSLLSDIGYIEPTSIDAYIRGNKLSPVLDAGDSTQAPTAWIWGLRLQVSLSYINRRALCQAVKYLSNVNRNLRDSEPQCALPAGVGHKVVYDIMLLRLGLRLIGKSIIHLQQDHLDGGNAVLNTVRDLLPEEIRIPQKLWELAGTVQMFYPDHSQPLSVQLEQLGDFLWRNAACYRDDDDEISGNQHLAYLTGVLVTVPSRWLQGVVVLDHVGYIPGDAACAETYSKLNKYAGNILAVAETRDAVVDRALKLLDQSRILQQLAAKVPNTPHVLVLMAAEKTSELLRCGQELTEAVNKIVSHGSPADLRQCLQSAQQWLQQYAAGEPLSKPKSSRIAEPQGSRVSSNQSDILGVRLFNLLKKRKKHEFGWLETAADSELKRRESVYRQAAAVLQQAAPLGQGTAVIEQSSTTPSMRAAACSGQEQALLQSGQLYQRRAALEEAGIFTLAWWPQAFHDCKQILQRQQHLGPDLIQEACLVLAEVTGVARLQRFVLSNKARWEDQQAAASIASHQSRSEQLNKAVPLTIDQLQHDMLTLLQGCAETQASAAHIGQDVAGRVEALQVLGQGSLKRFQQLVYAAVKEELLLHLDVCTVSRGLAEGVRMLLGDDVWNVPNWQQQLGYDLDPTAGGLVGPAEYSSQLWDALAQLPQGQFKHWLQCDHVGSSITKLSENITKTPAQCILSPLQEQVSSAIQKPFIRSTAEQQQQQQQHSNQHARIAQTELVRIANELESALQPSTSTEAQSAQYAMVSAQLQALRARIPSIIDTAFHSLADFGELMCPTIMQAMTESLYIGIANSLVPARKITMERKLSLLTSNSAELNAAMLQAVDDVLKEVVSACWEKLLHEVEVQIIRPLRFLQADQQQRQQRMQQSGGLIQAVREVMELRCYMSVQSSESNTNVQRQPSAAGPSSQAGSSCSTAATQLPVPDAIAQAILKDPDDSWETTLEAILPQPAQLQQLIRHLVQFAKQQHPMAGFHTTSTLQQLLQHPGHQLLQQCARELRFQHSFTGVHPVDVLQLWLSAIPSAVTIQDLEHVLCGTADADPAATGGAGPSAAAAADEYISVIGSEPYMKVLVQLLAQNVLPWKLSDLSAVVAPELTKLTTDGVLLPGQLISSLLPSVQQQIAIELYLGCYNLPPKSGHNVLNRRLVDVFVVPERVNCSETAAAGSSTTASDTASSALQRYPADRMFTCSSGQKLLRVSARPHKSAPGRRATHVTLPVCVSNDSRSGSSSATLTLDRDMEFALCETRVEYRNAGPVPRRVMSRLDRQAPPIILLATAMKLQMDQQQQQQQPSARATRTAGTGGQVHCYNLLRSYAQLWHDRLKFSLRLIQCSSSSSNSPQAASVPELLQEQHWDVIESMHGKPNFYYTGPLPAQLLAGAGSSSDDLAGSHVTVAFSELALALAFARYGKLHGGLKYLNTSNHQKLLRQFKRAKSETLTDQQTTTTGAPEGQPEHKGPPPAAAPAGAPAAAVTAETAAPSPPTARAVRSRKRSAAEHTGLRRITRSSQQPSAETAIERASSPVMTATIRKRCRTADVSSTSVTIGDVVAATPNLQSDEPVLLAFATSRKKVEVKLSSAGAFLQRVDFFGPPSKRHNLSRLDSNPSSPWLGPITAPSQLVKHATGLERRGWRDIYDSVTGTRRCWEVLRKKVTRQWQEAAVAANDHRIDSELEAAADD